jgi:hypothetical protein
MADCKIAAPFSCAVTRDIVGGFSGNRHRETTSSPLVAGLHVSV